MASEPITFTTHDKIALITLNLPQKLNALTQDLYYRLSSLLREVAARDDITITILTGRGRYFSAGADVSISRLSSSSAAAAANTDLRREMLRTFVANNLEITRAFYTHPKILITALNGPAVGLSAALIAFSDFIYAAPHAFLLTPFTSLGLVAEGAASRAFVSRLGIGKANEALIMGRRITAEELLRTGFVNKVFDVGRGGKGEKGGEDERFLDEVLKEVRERLGDHLNQESLLKVKALVRAPEREALDRQNVEEVFEGLERLARGIPQEEFKKIASGQKRHKL